MAQDLRKLVKQDPDPVKEPLPEGHRARFEQRLEQALPERGRPLKGFHFRFAAILVIALGIGAFFYLMQSSPIDNNLAAQPVEKKESKDTAPEEGQVTLADISPQFKKVEEYYLANINLGLSKIEITEENKALIDSFMEQLAALDKEYRRLNQELNVHGPNEETVEALIQNLQLRLDLLFKLKNKLEELKNEKDEKFNSIQV